MSTVTAVPLRPVKRGYVVWIWIGVALAVVAAALLAWAGDAGIRVTPSGLRYQIIKAGDVAGPSPTDTDVTLVQYEGQLADGTVFDKSTQPAPLPVRGVVPGFAEGLKLMHKGAKYRFWMKPELAYGAEGKGPIPPNSTLQFDVELVDFVSEAAIRQMQMQQMMQQGGAPGGAGPGAAASGGAMPGGTMPGGEGR